MRTICCYKNKKIKKLTNFFYEQLILMTSFDNAILDLLFDQWIITQVIDMSSFMRKIVAGPKKKTPFKGEQLDLTYITDRVIAMAYPASGFFQKTYRNNIKDVAEYFQEYHHNNYLIFNVSSRPYDYSLFGGRVKEYQWPDHQAPTISTLIDIANQAKKYLQSNPLGVIAVHCNHGKGRTGTAIISFMLFMGLFQFAQDALSYYNSRRFSSDDYGVDQPCQTRYLGYIQQLCKMKKIPSRIIGYRLSSVTQQGLDQKMFVTIKKTRTGEDLLGKFPLGVTSNTYQKVIFGDLFIELFQETWSGSKRIARINYNPFFLNPSAELYQKQMQVVFRSDTLKLSKKVQQKFVLKMDFEFFCLCHLQGAQNPDCECWQPRSVQQKYWQQMINQIRDRPQMSKTKVNQYFFKQSSLLERQRKKSGDAQILRKSQQKIEEDEYIQQIYRLKSTMSNLQVNCDTPIVGRVIGKKQQFDKADSQMRSRRQAQNNVKLDQKNQRQIQSQDSSQDD